MKSKLNWIMTLFLAFFIQVAFAQEKTVSGTVTDDAGEVLPGVSVVVQGTSKGTQTDFEGKYSLKVAVGDKLTFSFLGMDPQTITVGASNSVSVKLKTSARQLIEVVVEGYNITRPKTKSNVAVTTVSAATIEQRPNASFIQTLQSQVAGLNIATGSGQPGGNSLVILRGVASLNGKIEPLYVIDGVPLNADNFRSLNPDDIASVSVLKDAAATAKYGNRGSNGVIVVTTKKGSYESSLSIKYNVTTGFSKFQGNDYNMMNSRQILTLERERGEGLGATGGLGNVPLTDAQIASYGSTNWNNYFFRTGYSQNHTLSLTSGSKTLASFTSFGFFDQKGILRNTDLNRFTFRNNLTGRSANEKFNYSSNITINFSRRNEATSVGTGGVNQNYLVGANNGLPYISPSMWVNGRQTLTDYQTDTIFDPDSTDTVNGPLAGTLAYTPLFLVDKLNSFSNEIDELKGVAYFEASYKIAKHFTLGMNSGLDYTQQTATVFQDPEAFNSYVFQNGTEAIGFQTQTFQRDAAFNTNTSLNYNRSWGKHTLDVTAFTEYYKSHFNSFSYTQNGLDPKQSFPGGGSGYVADTENDDFNVPTVGASKLEAGLFSYFSVADYDYDGRFGLGATIRRDASSRFANSNRWGTFWSVSGRWNLDKEAFLQGSFINKLKIRASYGTNGNQDIANGIYNALNNTRNLYTVTALYQNASGLAPTNPANPNLKWETVTQTNIGTDFEMFDNRLVGTVDWYYKKTTDLFLDLTPPLSSGWGSYPGNFGNMWNRGLEVTLSYDLIRPADSNPEGLSVKLRFNGSRNINRIGDIATPSGLIDNGLSVVQEGRVLNEWFLVRYAGVNPATGNLLFYNKDGELTENPDGAADRVLTGKSSIPVYQGGFGADIDYHNFYVSAQFSYVADIWRYDYDLQGVQDPTDIGVFNKSTDILRAWTPDNRVTDMPSLTATNLSLDGDSDRYLKDASYVRLRYFTVGYNFPKRFLDKTFLKNLKVFAQAENLVTWSKWRGWDAESTRGSDQYQYPTPKIISLGAQIEF